MTAVHIVTLAKTPTGSVTNSTVEVEVSARIARDVVRIYLAEFLNDGWAKVPTPCKKGRARASTTIANEDGETITCTIIPKRTPRGLRRELGLSQ